MLAPDQKIKAHIGAGLYKGRVVKKLTRNLGVHDLYIVNLKVQDKTGFFVTRREYEIITQYGVTDDADEEQGSFENPRPAKDDGVLAELAAPEGRFDYQP